MIGERISDIKFLPLYSIFLLFITICGNFLSETLPCKFQTLIKNSRFVRYVFLFFKIYFLILSIAEFELWKNLVKTIIIFIWFCILIRNNYSFFIMNIFLLFIVYLLSIKELAAKQEGKRLQTLELINNLIIIITFFLTILGFLVNLNSKRLKYKNNFKFLRFLFGVAYCN